MTKCGHSIDIITSNTKIPMGPIVIIRIIDILKPWPVSLMEKLPGGWGIMADDIVGGIMGNIILQAMNAYLYHNGWLYSLIVSLSGGIN